MSLKPIQEGRLKSTVKKTVKNLRLVGRLEEGLFRTGALSQVIKASDRLWKKVKFCARFFGANLQKNWPISQEILRQILPRNNGLKTANFIAIFWANFTKIDLTSAVRFL